ncbi:MAG: hypothetical protein CVT88_05550 [Candidatus Altiarchaeales archaeon HGW-Altiarchaeales-1]|nr:MAG: hypothetical protein CVT89_02675 [Candidatus Altiarchaeales archaeon HGW-Altiarchaeales-2]PKP59410.1 MAG: hypothetical protein CVT88_05550 [Candidatus Altiarchaeales archaeon HGW-Altiarchaeales-1]
MQNTNIWEVKTMDKNILGKSPIGQILIVGTILILLVGIVLISGCIESQNNVGTNQSETIKNSTNETESLEKEIKITKEVNLLTLRSSNKLNITPQFKVGETYVYTTSYIILPFLPEQDSGDNTLSFYCEPVEFNTPIHIEGIERINKSDWIVIKSESQNKTPICYEDRGGKVNKIKISPLTYGGCTVKINKNNLSVLFFPETKSIESCMEIVGIMVDKWMFYLSEDTKLVAKWSPMIGCNATIEITVEGTEKVNNYECFKVRKTATSNCGEEIINEKVGQVETHYEEIYFIEKMNRIGVKYMRYTITQGGRLLEKTAELKEIKKPYK